MVTSKFEDGSLAVLASDGSDKILAKLYPHRDKKGDKLDPDSWLLTKEDFVERGASFEDAIFSIICNNIEDHRKRQSCLKGIIDAVKKWGSTNQLPKAAQQENKEENSNSVELVAKEIKKVANRLNYYSDAKERLVELANSLSSGENN